MPLRSDSEYAPSGSGSETRGRPRGSRDKRKRNTDNRLDTRRPPPRQRQDATDTDRSRAVSSLLEQMSGNFAQKQVDSANFGCFTPISKDTQVEAAKYCFNANSKVLTEQSGSDTIFTFCYWCQLMCRREEFCDAPWPWQDYYENLVEDSRLEIQILVECNQCFRTERQSDDSLPKVPTCRTCHKAMSLGQGRGKLARRAGFLQPHLRCMHRYPQELMDLTPIEERAISINTPFGYITKLRMDMKWVGTKYRKHVKGHICVFPNNTNDLTTSVLPRTLESTLDNFLITWSGKQEPSDKDLNTYTTVRPLAIERALRWLKANNPIYNDIAIDTDELSTWTPTRVTSAIRACTHHVELTADEQINTAHYTTAEDRGTTDETTDVMPEDLGIGTAGGTMDDRPQTISDRETEPQIDEDETTYERDSSGVFNVDGSLRSTDVDQLQFAVDALQAATQPPLSEAGEAVEDVAHENTRRGRMDLRNTDTATPYIHVRRGEEFADMNDLQFWPKTFPTLFPHGVGGARVIRLPESRTRDEENNKDDTHSQAGFSLRYWAKICLLRHGGRFSRHPVFQFLIFNTLVKSNNRRLSMQQIKKSSFQHFKEKWKSLTPERLRQAAKEMEGNQSTKDKDIQDLMRRLSSFGYSFPLSPEARRQMRKKIQSSLIHFGLPVLWFTINPNDLTSPIKKWLSICQSALPEDLQDLFQRLEDNYERMRFSIEDPVSSAIFFHRELDVFFSNLVKVGQNSCLGKVSHYIGVVETNERGMLHLHGMIWLNGNLEVPKIAELFSEGQRNAETENTKEALKRQLETWADTILCQTLDEEDARLVAEENGDVYNPLNELTSNDPVTAWEGLVRDSNRVAYTSQLHRHTATCYKYKTSHCRFGAPWTRIDHTNMGDDCILKLERNHDRVVTYNRAIASAFRHNHDIAFMYTKARSLASMYYMTNYSTKLDLPMWKRLAYAAQVRDIQMKESDHEETNTRRDDQGYSDQARQFLMRTANRMNTDQEVSSVEVSSYLLGFESFISPQPNTGRSWPHLNMTQLYHTVLRNWPHARDTILARNPFLESDEGVTLTQSGVKINHLIAYPLRGPTFRSMCLYDYMTMVSFSRLTVNTRLVSPRLVPFPDGCELSTEWIQMIQPISSAIPCISGYIDSYFGGEDPDYPARAEIQHLGLFVPWHKFLDNSTDDPSDIWFIEKESLADRILFHVDNCTLLRRSATDAKVDAAAWADKCATADPIADDYEGTDDEDEREETPASEHEQLSILRDVLECGTGDGLGLNFLDTLYQDLSSILDDENQNLRWETNSDPSNCNLQATGTEGVMRTQRFENINILESRFGPGSASLEMQIEGIPDPDTGFNPTGKN